MTFVSVERMKNMNVKEKIERYMDAGFPLIYLETFEEDKADILIHSIASNKIIVEHNIKSLSGYKDLPDSPKINVAEAPDIFLDNLQSLNQSILIFKDIHFVLDNPEVIARLKYLLQAITNGQTDCNVVIISPVLKIPKELENYMTILFLDYLSQSEIRKIIIDFCKE